MTPQRIVAGGHNLRQGPSYEVDPSKRPVS